ncbi:MAG: hypothetical protein RSA24_06255, partial [Clostridia bacterium]
MAKLIATVAPNNLHQKFAVYDLILRLFALAVLLVFMLIFFDIFCYAFLRLVFLTLRTTGIVIAPARTTASPTT